MTPEVPHPSHSTIPNGAERFTVNVVINDTVGVTVNDVFLAVMGGALRRYLRSHDDLPDKSLERISGDMDASAIK